VTSIDQVGNNNTAEQFLFISESGPRTEAAINQSGDDNVAKQDGFNPRGRLDLTIVQDGNSNEAFQNSRARDVVAVTNQTGDFNFADTFQEGRDNTALITQYGDDNEAWASQIGDLNHASIDQMGDGNFGEIDQMGNNNSASISQ